MHTHTHTARPRIHQSQRQVRRLGPAERSRQEAAGLRGEQPGDAGEVHHRRREGNLTNLPCLPTYNMR